MTWPFTRRTSPPVPQSHQYMADILTATKLRQTAMQRVILQATDANRAELQRLDKEIAVMQAVHIKLLEKEQRKLEGEKSK